jgi:hypothetical protein
MTLGHSYEYGLDVDTSATSTPAWQVVRRISNLAPGVTPITQSAQTYDDFGSPNADKTGESWTLGFSVNVNRSTSTGLYTPEVEAILAKEKPAAKGADAVLHVRYYHKPESGTPNPNDAYEGYATVSVSRANTAADGAVEVLNSTLTGKGPRTEIANPFTGWGAVVPTITSVSPSGQGEDDQVTITGSAFTGATDVDFGASPASTYTVVSDSTIVAVLPAGSAGSVNVVVTNATGPSATFAYTRAI